MADLNKAEFNRSGLTVKCNRVWYTGQRAEKIPAGLIRIVGSECTSLDVSYNELTSISAVRDFVNLEELILDNNKLRDLSTLPHMPKLLTLSLNNNKFKDIDSLLQKIKNCCPKIQYVSLLGNPGCPDQLTDPDSYDEDDYNRYRLYAIYVLPKSLTFLDSRMVTQKERQDAEHRGCFLKTVRFALQTTPEMVTQNSIDEIDEIIFNLRYTPLPKTQRNPQDHRAGAFGKFARYFHGLAFDEDRRTKERKNLKEKKKKSDQMRKHLSLENVEKFFVEKLSADYQDYIEVDEDDSEDADYDLLICTEQKEKLLDHSKKHPGD